MTFVLDVATVSAALGGAAASAFAQQAMPTPKLDNKVSTRTCAGMRAEAIAALRPMAEARQAGRLRVDFSGENAPRRRPMNWG